MWRVQVCRRLLRCEQVAPSLVCGMAAAPAGLHPAQHSKASCMAAGLGGKQGTHHLRHTGVCHRCVTHTGIKAALSDAGLSLEDCSLILQPMPQAVPITHLTTSAKYGTSLSRFLWSSGSMIATCRKKTVTNLSQLVSGLEAQITMHMGLEQGNSM